MSDISFQKSRDGYVAEFDAPGNILMQIQSEKGGRLTMYQFIEGMEPAKINTCQFTNEFNILWYWTVAERHTWKFLGLTRIQNMPQQQSRPSVS